MTNTGNDERSTAVNPIEHPTGSLPPVAVVGVGCRFPGGVNSPGEFWDLLMAGRNTVGEIPPGRWESYRDFGPRFDAALRTAIRSGSFLDDDIAGFDAEFFGISPREAELMDPQQRLVLEVAWQALEHAGIAPHTLAGSDTGVFAGVCTYDYGAGRLEDLPDIEAWTGIGAAVCGVSNRVSHALDLRGPSLSVDTACSASLVALHTAAQSLRLGECTLALAGGVNLVVSPGQTLALGAAGALAPDGRSKPFSASADGYGRGEGCGVLVLKLLADAERDGDRVLAVLRGSAVNQDGRTNGIMAPCGQAQEHVMRRALAAAGVTADTVGFVEAHGTGTRVGDPMEVGAIGAVYGQGRSGDEACVIGSVKSNIGHLEGAAGVAGVIKAVLTLGADVIPASLLDGAPNPEIDWAGLDIRLATSAVPWPERPHPRRAAVSGFGYGGTVAHVVLEQAPTAAVPAPDAEPAGALFPVSAASPGALGDRAAALARRVEEGADLASLGHTLAHRLSPLEHRAAVVATDREELAAGLRALAAGEPAPGVVTGAALPAAGRPVWVFSGHGSQWAGMGRELLEAEPVFAEVIDSLEPVFKEEIGFSPRQMLLESEHTEVDGAQTMIFAMQLGLAALWRSRGVEPAAVVGHSVGEIAAAVTAGALSTTDGARLICRRSSLLREVAGRGAMAMVSLPFDEVAERLAGNGAVVAAIASSTASTVISGDPGAVEEIVGRWSEEGTVVRRVASDVAFHSPHMDPLLERLRADAGELEPRTPHTRLYTTALADPRAGVSADGAYWAANLRNPVRLAAAVAAAAEDGHRAFVELSPHPVVAHSIHETLAACDVEDVFVGTTLRRNRPEAATFRAAVGAAHCHDVAVDWSTLQPGGPQHFETLPSYPWQHRPLWRSAAGTRGGERGHDVGSHTLLGTPGGVAGSEVRLWHSTLDDDSRPYPGSHALNGVEIVPAAVLVATFLAARPEDGESVALADMTMTHPVLTAGQRQIQVVRDGAAVRLASRTVADASDPNPGWLVHTEARTVAPDLDGLARQSLLDPGEHRLEPADPGMVARRLAEVGVPSTGFEWGVESLSAGLGVLRALVSSPDTTSWAPLLDAVMSIAPAAFEGLPLLRMVVRVDGITVAGPPPSTATVEVVPDPGVADTVHALVTDQDGRPVASLRGLRYPVVEQSPVPEANEPGSEALPEAVSFSGLAPDELRSRLLEVVREQIAQEMRLAPASLHVRRPLVEQGLDSVMTVVVRRRLEKRLGRDVPADIFWKLPTINAIVDHLTERFTEDGRAS
ncbi:type I polyketide synthase [Streptomyces sp. NPDC091272]|uniref:type I polyketide synthase n=1 Tax=Streptomyces sp. NPDC091272 TaxID=3365981 RepID=UPI003816AF48